ncbi:hypothetical protein NAEGRDRAFT_78435 [Naegleria gruberi]|uniref:Uncharacterized protein n=1 Tax=Naegleria gruberi TaxID=5762 RepID=D2V3N2_NAEGR|nr:uncharacterized protein NAEGRDRAFT_78435 [Naegleria gruberi]EFC48666.1 hypothetical protein NAEGRDRAFT_78435 [Naegleria gruberi]|eukprot:XP_002681410.1 hypothetical protein NAEGRDRAFT_78435 [Naegleria gruberi strain NEG-M]
MPTCVTFVCVCGSKLNSRQAKYRHLKKCSYFDRARQFIRITIPQTTLCKIIDPQVSNNIATFDSDKPDPHEAAYMKMGRAVVGVIKDLPITSPIRKPLIAKICKTVRPKDAREILNLDESTIRKAKKNNDNSILMMKCKPNCTREKITKKEIDQIQRFWLDSCRVSSTEVLQTTRKRGETPAITVPKYWQDQPTCWIYKQYVDYCEERVLVQFSVGTFVKYKPKNIRPSKKLEGVCPICKDFNQNGEKYQQASELLHHVRINPDCECEKCQHFANCSKTELLALQKKYDKYLLHDKLVKDKDQYWKKVKAELKEDELIVVMDFASGWEVVDKAVETTNEFFEKFYIKDMIVVVIRKLGDEFEYYYIDILNDNHNSDHHYVRESWEYLLSNEEIFAGKSKLFLFSDGGPAHYKTCKTVVMVGEMSRKFGIPIEYNFFPSHHGKGPCDAHTGVGKKFIKNKVQSRQIEVQTLDDIQQLLQQLKNTKVIHLEDIETFDDYNVQKVANVRSFHQYTYEFDSEGEMDLLCKISYEDEHIEVKSAILLSNCGVQLQANHCLFCREEGHNHRVCDLMAEEYLKEDFDPSYYDFLSRENDYLPDREEDEDEEEYSSSDDGEDDTDNVSEISIEVEPTREKRNNRGNRCASFSIK